MKYTLIESIDQREKEYKEIKNVTIHDLWVNGYTIKKKSHCILVHATIEKLFHIMRINMINFLYSFNKRECITSDI